MTVIALLQLDPTVGDLAGNVALVEAAVAKAAEAGADMAVTSELVISGYPPRDMLMDAKFVSECESMSMEVNSPIPLLIGTPLTADKERQKPFNGVVRVDHSRTSKIVGRKQLLPTYDVFDEGRYFQSDDGPGSIEACKVHPLASPFAKMLGNTLARCPRIMPPTQSSNWLPGNIKVSHWP
ncbi:MAG: hypothetical protein Ct9H90mP16_17340 [Candidatus Poseidoniales archaeon]|nr:MAG: hypothetical protein Ct9H90mP16_17340 [Candidatus Poseidoniales archaeon]